MARNDQEDTDVERSAVTPPPADLISARTERRIVDHHIRMSEESWVKSYWRPAMAWLYMLICFVDFVFFPALSMFLPAILKGVGVEMEYAVWTSLTLSNGGLIHMAFGAIIGVAAWSRGREKMLGSN